MGFAKRLFLMCLICALAIAGLGMGAPQTSAAGAVTRVYLYLNQKEAFVNNQPVLLDSPATVVKGKTYVPVKFLGDTFGFSVQYDSESKSISMKAGETDVWIDTSAKTALVNGLPQPMEPMFLIINGRLMAQLTWMMDQIDAEYTYQHAFKRVEVVYAPYSPELPAAQDSKPIAKFTFGKKSYKMGEKIKYIDLSYDVEGDGIAYVSWKNKQDAFFTPGEHEVSLQVTDSKGNVSDWFTKKITIENETLYEYVPFQMRYAALNSFISLSDDETRKHLIDIPYVPVQVRQDRSRSLIVSNSPETVQSFGVLYRDAAAGKTRLYASHINGMEQNMKFAIAVTNTSSEPVTIRTTRQGEVYPSRYVNLVGYQASVDFLDGDPSPKPDLTLMPGETQEYVVLSNLAPGEGINLIYDIETTGEVLFSFAALRPHDRINAVFQYPELEYVNHIRGTFDVADVYWQGSLAGRRGPMKLTLGDGTRDEFVEGIDVFRQGIYPNKGNYGVLYHIRLQQPGEMAVVMRVRGGGFKGAFKFNGEIVRAPISGSVTMKDPVYLLYRTDGSEPYLDMEYTPPAASSFPIDLVFYPLD